MAVMARRSGPRPPKPAPSPERQIAFGLGISAESRAAAWLIAHGYRILARRWKSPLGEIDIIAARRHTLIFVEVKARATLDDAAFAVTDRQKQRIAAAAEIWLAKTRCRPFATCASTRFWSRPANCRGIFRRRLKLIES